MNALVLGLQWGDEGKGKVIDFFAADFDVVVRFQGGHNAGHTVYHNGQKTVLHLIPSAVFSERIISVIAAGVVVNPLYLVEEIQRVRALGCPCEQFFLSEAAPLILPHHQQLDAIGEDASRRPIGTTRRGIGPAYEDLVGRRAMFVRDLLDREGFAPKVRALHDHYNFLIRSHSGQEVALESYVDAYVAAGEFLRGHIVDTTYLLHRFLQEGKRILLESAQGTLLDISLGTYPFVTSSHPTVGGAAIGTGIPGKAIQRVIGVSKAYTTRVGEGPFPTELHTPAGDLLREKGNEFGSTTGRPRRVGWLDLVALKYAVLVNGVDAIFLTKLDVLDDLAEIPVCTAYETAGKLSGEFSAHADYLAAVKPHYVTLPGWQKNTAALKRRRELPKALRAYLTYIENFLQVPVEYISLGTAREQTVRLV